MTSSERRQRHESGAGPISRAQTSKIDATHLDRLAVVYLRQSTAQQIHDHPESTARQYALVGRAEELGWRKERVVVIDEDLGCSGRALAGRVGFQRLLDELEMGHVGLVLGLEMSRLARSGRDWHHLFEVCAFRRSLLADEQGVYDPLDTNDRMLLGLKGIMSEVELQIMRGRLERGRVHKAKRGELFHQVPRGYVRVPGGGVEKDPDEQVQSVVKLVFEKYMDLPSAGAVVNYLRGQNIRLPSRTRSGAVQWRPASWHGVYEMLRHPIYAGAYAYGRRDESANSTEPTRPEDEWQILIRDQVPAYIDWSQYLANRHRMSQNRPLWQSKGPCREGPTLLGGLLFCGRCGRRMQVTSSGNNEARYYCSRRVWETERPRCGGVVAKVLDTLVSEQVLIAIEPASLELSMQVLKDTEQEYERKKRHLEQQVERARYEVGEMERNCLAVDPENRLVRRALEKRWEEALGREQEARESYQRFLDEKPGELTEQQREKIESLSSDLPALWHRPDTSASDRQQIVRCLVDRVSATLHPTTQHIDVEIQWVGGFVGQHRLTRSVQTYEQLEEFSELRARLIELRRAGYRSPQIARTLDEEGFRTPKMRRRFTSDMVSCLMRRREVVEALEPSDLPADCWRVPDLAREMRVSERWIKNWARRGWGEIVQRPFGGVWVLRLDPEARKRLDRDAQSEGRGGFRDAKSRSKGEPGGP